MIKAIVSDFSRVVLNPKDINYKGSLNSLYKEHKEESGFSFFDYFELNEEILSFYKSLKDKVSVSLFTTDVIQNAPEIKNRIEEVFSNIFSANYYNLDKKDPNAYSFIVGKLNTHPSEILYIDDNLDNIEAARRAGLNVREYRTINDLINAIQNTLS